ncbi:MAG: tetratricopeptide repeat protein [Acidobacteriota bacterium]|jgi:tetratricopeptide (TPR) repeat protein
MRTLLAGLLLGAVLTAPPALHAATAAPAEAGAPALRPVDEPVVDGMEPSVREQLAHFRALVDSGLAASDPDPRKLLVGHARLGQLYLLYGFEGAAEDCFANARALAPDDARWTYYLGVSLERQGRHEEAATELEHVLAARPGDPATLLRLGWIELQKGRPEQAERWFRRRLEAEPDSAAALFGLGQVALDRGSWEEAARRFQRALELQPDATAIHYPLGLALRQLGDLEGARKHLARRGDRAPAFPDPLVTDLDTLAAGAWPHMDRGRELLDGGDLEGALAAYRAAVEAEPTSVHAHKSLAHALTLAGDLAGTVREYRTALELDPDQPGVHQRLGSVLARGGNLDEGIRHLRRAVELAPDFAEAYGQLSVALERTGRTEEALGAAREVLRIRPEDSTARLEHARLRLLARIDPSRELVPQLRRRVVEDPDDAVAWLTLGSILGELGDETGRMEAYRSVLELDGHEPMKARAHMLIARGIESGEESGEDSDGGPGERVISHLRSAVRLAPDLAATHAGLAGALARAGDTEGAARAYRRALALEPSRVEWHLGLARALAAAGRRDEARASLREAVAAAPADPRPRELLRSLEDPG